MQFTPEQRADLIEALNGKVAITRKHIGQVLDALPEAMEALGISSNPMQNEIVNLDDLLISFLNNANNETLDEVSGIGEASIDAIVAARPLSTRAEVESVLTTKQLESVEKHLKPEGE